MDPSASEDAPLERLRRADLSVVGLLSGASNATLLVRLDGDEQRYAVYKPQRGERPLWDFPRGTLHRREVAAFLVSELLGWDVVPPTVLREGPAGVGSVQQFVVHDPAEHYFTLVEDPERHAQLARLAVFDLLVNNADRKGGHVLAERGSPRLIGIDHGLTFHVEPKLRTVIWDLGGWRIPGEWREDLRRLRRALEGDDRRHGVCDMLATDEVAGLARRAGDLAGLERLPDVAPNRRPYPWPPV